MMSKRMAWPGSVVALPVHRDAARRQIHRYRLRDFVTKAQINQSLQDHRKVARAIQEGDEVAAAREMLLHVPSGSTGFSEFLASIPMHLFEAEPDSRPLP